VRASDRARWWLGWPRLTSTFRDTVSVWALRAGTGDEESRESPVATYVLIHGGAHGGWCYQRVAPILRAADHTVYTPTLTGLGERSHLLHPDIDLETHIADVVNTLHYEDLTDVILVGHSYGGMVITGTADRALDRLGQLVYLDGALPENGESLAEMTPVLMETVHREGRVVDGVDLVLWPGPEAGRNYGVTDPVALAWMQDRLTPHPWKSFTQPLQLRDEAAVKSLPRTNINCTETLSRRPAERAARAFQADRVWEIETGHDLMITEPQAVAEMLLLLATLETESPRSRP
jgi:pimeloyl-ACP methyl ester carboxylesterase